MSELHLVSPNDELSRRNGSAVLRVASELTRAAIEAHEVAAIGGGIGKLIDLPESIEVLRVRNPKRLASLVGRLDSAAKYLLGRSSLAPRLQPPVGLQPDVVYCHNLPWVARSARSAFPESKLILYVHNKVLTGARPSILRRTLRQFDGVVCVSDYIANDLRSRAKLAVPTSPPIFTVFNGVDAGVFSAQDGASKDTDVVYVGRIIPEKGTLVLAKAMASLQHSHGYSLRLVGGATFLPSGEVTAYEREVVDVLAAAEVRVERTGPVPPSAVPELVNSSRVIVVPSIWDEPCALVFLEGMASDAAVIAASVGGLPEVGADAGVTFVPREDADALATAINSLLASPAEAESMSSLSRKWATNRPWRRVYGELNRAVESI